MPLHFAKTLRLDVFEPDAGAFNRHGRAHLACSVHAPTSTAAFAIAQREIAAGNVVVLGLLRAGDDDGREFDKRLGDGRAQLHA